MIEEQAVVVARAGDRMTVEVQRRSACGNCAQGKGCGTAVLSDLFGGRRPVQLSLEALPEVAVGDRVVVAIDENSLQVLALWLYLLPLFGLLGGAVVGNLLGDVLTPALGEPMSIVCGAVGLALALLGVRRYGAGSAQQARHRARVVRRVPALLPR